MRCWKATSERAPLCPLALLLAWPACMPHTPFYRGSYRMHIRLKIEDQTSTDEIKWAVMCCNCILLMAPLRP